MQLRPDTKSYMQFSLNLEGSNIYLRVPVFFERLTNEWLGCVNLTQAKKTITGKGKNCRQLAQNFNDELSKSLNGEDAQETLELFKPLSYWYEMTKE